MGVDGPHKTAGHLQNTPKARLPLVAAGSQSALYVYVYVYAYVHAYAYRHEYGHACVHMHVCVYAYVYVRA